MRTLRSITIGLLIWTALAFWGHVVGMGGGPVSATTKSIDVVAKGPKFETEPVEINSNIDMEADTREKDYTLESMPTGAPLPRLEFVSPGAGGFGHAAKITTKVDEAGMLTRTILADKGQRMTFSVKVRAEEIGSVGLVAVPLARRPQARAQLLGLRPDTSRRPLGAAQPQGPGADAQRAQRPRKPLPAGNAGPRRPRGFAIERSKTLSGSYDWTTLSIDLRFRDNIDEAQFQMVVRGPGTVWVDDFSVAVHLPKIVEIPEEPAAPLLLMVLMHSETPQAYIRSRDYFRADAMKYEEMAKMLNRYGARLVVEPEREIWLGAKKYDPDFLSRLHNKYGVSFSVHTHGPNPRMNPTRQDVLDYIKFRKDEMETMGAGPVTDLNGNFDQNDWDMFAEVGIRTMTAYKHPPTQLGLEVMEHYYLHLWRPGGSPFQSEEQFARHNPDCEVIFLPGVGAVHTRHHERFSGLIERHLRVALSRVRADRINVSYFVEHVGRFVSKKPRQSPWEYVNSEVFRDNLEEHEKLYRDFLAPLVKSGHVRYVVPSEVGELFEAWERKMEIAVEH